MNAPSVDSSGSPPTVISTFAGCGGSSLGYKLAGFKEMLAVEWDDNAAETFRLNFPDMPVYHGDICKLTGAECMRLAGVKVGELDVLDGSPPCQGFSIAGKRKFDDPRNSLFREYARLLRELQPRVFVMENVTGMVKGAMKQAYLTIIAELRECGYRAKGEVLNAMYFNVPQSRERVIIIGVRKDLGIEPSHPKPQTRPVVCGDVLAEKDFDNALTPDQYAVWVEKRRNTWRRSTWFNFEILNPREPSPTICKESGNAKFCHWDNPCAVGINGYKKLASFPDNFIFSGDYSHSKERIGNSVPPNLMRAIAEHIRFNILSQLQIRPSGGK